MLTDFLINSLSYFMACCQTGNGLLPLLSLASVPVGLVLLHLAVATLLCCCLMLNCPLPSFLILFCKNLMKIIRQRECLLNFEPTKYNAVKSWKYEELTAPVVYKLCYPGNRHVNAEETASQSYSEVLRNLLRGFSFTQYVKI